MNIPKDITLRDYFAGQVLSGISTDLGPEKVAVFAYLIADEMLKKREKAGEARELSRKQAPPSRWDILTHHNYYYLRPPFLE